MAVETRLQSLAFQSILALTGTPPCAVRIESLIQFPHTSFRKSNQWGDTPPYGEFAMNEDQIPGNLELHRLLERRFLGRSRCLERRGSGQCRCGRRVCGERPQPTHALKASTTPHLFCTFGLMPTPSFEASPFLGVPFEFDSLYSLVFTVL